MKGPSTWHPTTVDPVAATAAIAVIAATSSAADALTRLASIVVVPRDRWCAATAATSAGSPEVTVWLPPPWQWMSTYPGTTVPAGSGTGPGQPDAGPTYPIVPSRRTSSTPSSRIPAVVTSRPASASAVMI